MKQFKKYFSVNFLIDAFANEEYADVIYSLSKKIDEDITNPYLYEILVTNGQQLSDEYFINRMDKWLSPLYERLIEEYGENATGLENTGKNLANIIYSKYFFNWNKLAEGFFADYNPIHNYDMEEHEEVDNVRQVNTDVTAETETSDTQKFAGFNSLDESLPTATESEGSSETTTSGEKATNESVDDDERTLTRKGNIGVTTTAQMLTQEFELRRKTLQDKIYEDLDKILFLDYYL